MRLNRDPHSLDPSPPIANFHSLINHMTISISIVLSWAMKENENEWLMQVGPGRIPRNTLPRRALNGLRSAAERWLKDHSSLSVSLKTQARSIFSFWSSCSSICSVPITSSQKPTADTSSDQTASSSVWTPRPWSIPTFLFIVTDGLRKQNSSVDEMRQGWSDCQRKVSVYLTFEALH